MKEVLETVIEDLVNDFNFETLQEFFYLKVKDRWKEYREPLHQYEDDLFVEVWRVGEFDLKNNTHVGVYTVAVEKELTERSSKKRQFELAKKVLKDFPDAGFFVFHDPEGNFRFSFIYFIYSGIRRQLSPYKRFTYYVAKERPYRTFVKALFEANFDTLDNIISAFNTRPLTKEFYTEIQNWYAWALKHIQFPGGVLEENLIRLITRLIFVWFLKEKKLIPEEIFDPEFLKNVVKDFGKADHYYNVILQNLFFATLNKKPDERAFAKDEGFPKNKRNFGVKTLFRYENFLLISEDEFIRIFEKVPFINGGLFECLDRDDQGGEAVDGFSRREKIRAKLPDFLFFAKEQKEDLSNFYGTKKIETVRGLINILKDYNFTADENSPIDVEVSLDPELLGHIFENLLASYNPETATTARKSTGSYYTPKEIVDFMVEESLIEYFKDRTGIEEEKLREVFSYEEKTELSQDEKEKLINAIDRLKVLDPAVGSGAFPMGVLHKLVHVLGKIDPENELWYELQYQKALHELEEVLKIKNKAEREKRLKEINENFDDTINYPDYARKLYLIENSIYGVDIQPIAIQICKLRFFLSLLIDQKVDFEKENYEIKPLPHFETRFIAANTLIGLERPKQAIIENLEILKFKEELKRLYKRHFNIKTRTEKNRLKEKADRIKEKIKKLLEKDGWPNTIAEKIASFDIFDQTATANWFDPEWMFGVEDGFDIVIGNPPHGAKIEDIKDKIQNIYKFYEKRKNSASLFLELAYTLLKKQGITCFVIPKSFTFVSSWKKTRNFVLFDNQLLFVVDISKAFENVKLEQVILAYKKVKLDENYKFKTGDYWSEEIKIISSSDTAFVKKLDLIPVYIDTKKIGIFNKIIKDSVLLSQISKTLRGLPFQKKIISNGKISILRGNNLGKYIIYGNISKVNLSESELQNKKLRLLKQKKIVSQRIVAHVMNPFDRIIIMATLDNEGYLTLDTVMNTFITDPSFNYLYILGILNSKLAEWFYYWFVYNRAIRTMDFDKYYMGKLPIKKITSQNQPIAQKIEQLVDKILFLTQSEDYLENKDKQTQVKEYEKEIDHLVYKLYDLTDKEIELIEKNIS